MSVNTIANMSTEEFWMRITESSLNGELLGQCKILKADRRKISTSRFFGKKLKTAKTRERERDHSGVFRRLAFCPTADAMGRTPLAS